MATALTVENSGQLKQIIADLLVQAEALTVLLTDIGGNVMAQAPERDDPEIQTVAALAAGSFCATRELASLSGERAFHAVCHEGEETSIYVANVEGDYLLLVIFQKVTTLGLVKLYARKAAKDMRPILKRVSDQIMAAAPDASFDLSDAPVFELALPAEVSIQPSGAG